MQETATSRGLRVSEIIGLRVGDVRVGVPKPYLNLRREITKRHKPRRVPLWWDQGTLDDLTAWREQRLAAGATSGDQLRLSHLAGFSRRAFATAFTRWWQVCGFPKPGQGARRGRAFQHRNHEHLPARRHRR